MLNLAAIVGPTAVGKTGLAIEVARRINGEILSCDSMQVYRGMDIGTAKATREERATVPHHLIDVADLDEDFNVARYQQEAQQIIKEVNQRGKLPILVGGTGLYYQAVVDDYQFFPMQSKQKVRDKWNNVIELQGLEEVYRYLKNIDPIYADRISSTDQKRIIRAIEVFELTGIPFSRQQTRNQGAYKLAVVGLDMERKELYARIDQRVEEMVERGWVQEVEDLLNLGYNPNATSMQALGYKQAIWYLQGLLSKSDMIKEIKRETRHYAKRQLTWFRRDQRIYWIQIETWQKSEILVENIFGYMEGQFPGA